MELGHIDTVRTKGNMISKAGPEQSTIFVFTESYMYDVNVTCTLMIRVALLDWR